MIENFNSFIDAIQQDGMNPPENITPGFIFRMHGIGKSNVNTAGWGKMFADGLGGVYGDFSSNLSKTWQADKCKQFTSEEKTAFNKQVEESRKDAELEREKCQAECRIWCTDNLEKADTATDEHPYLKSKGVHSYGLRQSGENLLISLRDGMGETHGCQFIDTNGTKKFKTGTAKQGHYFSIGKPKDNILLICEGYATGASLHEATGYLVAVAFDAGNLLSVASNLRKKFPEMKLIICADNDLSGVGQDKAREAARAVGGMVVVPTDIGDDFNDLHQKQGLRAVLDFFKSSIVSEDSAGIKSEPVDDKNIIKELAALSPLDYDRTRRDKAKELKVRPATLDATVKAAKKKEKTETGLVFDDLEPWPDPVDGAILLSEIAVTVHRFIVCSSETACAVALWVAMTWFMLVVQIAPLAVITSPEKRCGKSQLLFLLRRLVYRALTASNISTAALFRTIDAWRPTMLVDEADSFMKENEDMRGLLNSGHTRDGAYIIRVVGDDHEPKRFNTWGAKALAGIGKLPDTLMDRAVVMELRRKLPHEKVERLRYAEPGLFDILAAKLCRFAEDNQEAVRFSRPNLPAKLNDRAQDNWEPLLAIADVAGGQWPALARDAALKLAGSVDAGLTPGVELLSDIQEIFDSKKVDRISTAELITALCEDEEKPWATYNRGFQIKPRQVAKRLSEYGICSNTIRISASSTPKGFTKSQFEDAFLRYLTLPPILSATTPQAIASKDIGVADRVISTGSKTQNATPEQLILKGCGGVADKIPQSVFFTQEEENFSR